MKKLLSSMKNMDTRVKTAFSLYAFYVLILCVALSLALLTGCKSDSDPQSSSDSEPLQKTEITLACFSATRSINDAVALFNAANADYQILVVDYSQFGTDDDYFAGLTRLNAEIISGNVPDILYLNLMPYKQYVARGLLENLYPYIDTDPDYSRSDFMESVFRAAEIDGGLYQLISSFSVNTLVGNPAVVGDGMGWNVEEFLSVIKAHPEADVPLGHWMTKLVFLQTAVALSIDDYINWGAETAHFDTDAFIRLLEFANTFPDEQEQFRTATVGEYEAVSMQNELIPAGRQILERLTFGDDWSTYHYYKFLFGGELVFKGFPTASRNGNSLNINSGFAIMTGSANKEGAWAFLRTFLDKDWQLANSSGFPTNIAAFEAVMDEVVNTDVISSVLVDGEYVELSSVTEADVDVFLDLIDFASGAAEWNMDTQIWDVISESAADYFNGLISAERAAEIIQSRVSILVSERG